MREIAVKVYHFSELLPSAKASATQRHAELFGYSMSTEAFRSIEKLAEHFGGKVKDYEVDFFYSCRSSMKFDMPEMDHDEIESRLADLGHGTGECKLTGYFLDEDAIDGFRKEWNEGERDLGKLMQGAFTSWLKAAQADCVDYYSDEQFSETCEANEWEFYKDGSIVEKQEG